MRTPGIAHGFLSWAASQEMRSAGTWSFLLPRAPSSSRGGVVLGKALPRRVPAQPLAHGPRCPQHGQLGAQHQQVSVVSQWAVMGGARGGGGSCTFSVSLALHIVPPTPNPIQKVWGHAQTCLSTGPVHLHVKRVSRQPHASWWCLRQARAAPDVGVDVDAWPGGRDPVRGREFYCECFGVRCPGHPPWS